MGAYVPLKNYFGGELAERLAMSIQPYYPEFPVQHFVSKVEENIKHLELKARVSFIADEIHRTLHLEYPDQLNILLKIIGPENMNEEGMFTEGYYLMPITNFVERYGVNHFELSMSALYELTKRHTSEYAIRPYVQRYPEQCVQKLLIWSRDSNFHVRRLVSEGTRPRLPWAQRIDVLNGNPLINLTLLEPLLEDRSRYVRRSVANHLNDLTKDYKAFTIEWITRQLNLGRFFDRSMVQHALRYLVKIEDKEALYLLKKYKKS